MKVIRKMFQDDGYASGSTQTMAAHVTKWLAVAGLVLWAVGRRYYNAGFRQGVDTAAELERIFGAWSTDTL